MYGLTLLMDCVHQQNQPIHKNKEQGTAPGWQVADLPTWRCPLFFEKLDFDGHGDGSATAQAQCRQAAPTAAAAQFVNQ